MFVNHHRTAGDGLHHRHIVTLSKGRQFGDSSGVEHPTSGNDQRFFRPAENLSRRRNAGTVWPRTQDLVYRLLEESFRVIERLPLDILGQREKRRSAIGGIEHRRHRLRERGDQLLRAVDAVPVAGDRVKGIGHRHGWVVKILHLLQDRIRKTIGEGVSGQEQYGQPIGVGGGCDMFELGDFAADQHRAAGRAAAKVDHLICVGALARHIREGAIAAGLPERQSQLIAVETESDESILAACREVAELLLSTLQSGDVVLLKASNGMQFARIVEALSNAWERP